MIIEKVVVGPFATNCYIVGEEQSREGIIIDPGDEAKRILKRVEELQLDIKLLLLTHGHIDHAGALKETKEATGAAVGVHVDDANFERYRSAGLIFGLVYPHPPVPDRLLRDGDRVAVGGLQFEVLHTPGHTPGGVCFSRDGVIFTGDTLFNGSVGRTDLIGGNYDQLLDSIRKRLLVLDDDIVVHPGHGGDTTIAAERRDNPFLADRP